MRTITPTIWSHESLFAPLSAAILRHCGQLGPCVGLDPAYDTSCRYESLKHCKWVDEVVEDAPWVVDEDFIAVHQVMFGVPCLWRWCCGGIGGGDLTCTVVLHILSGVMNRE